MKSQSQWQFSVLPEIWVDEGRRGALHVPRGKNHKDLSLETVEATGCGK